MSLDKRKQLSIIAKKLCRELRLNQTESEKIIWGGIRNRQLLSKKFLRRHPIFFDLTGKETFYIADFYCHELKLVIEIDGEIHKSRKEYDRNRDEYLKGCGCTVLRFTNEEIDTDTTLVLQTIEQYLK
mgnify:CR=1 FL=1